LSVHIAPEVAETHERGGAIVALESTLIAHGLPRPRNLEVARELEAAVRAEGAVPATVAVVAGRVRIGLDAEALEVVAGGDGVAKCSVRDLGPVMARAGHGATTVASTAHLAARAGIGVFATGGLGGVHREATESFDESADLATLARTPIVVVCAGVKSLLDVGATLERLESLSVTVLGYGTDAFPGFYLSDSGHPAPGRADSPEEVAEAVRAARAVSAPGAIVVANPLPPDQQLAPDLHERVLREGLAAARAEGIAGKDVTPFLLDRFHRETGGASLQANVRLVLRNAALAARIAVALAG
jgi:pseudouridine-5'-phosphate glycosidase